MSDTKHRQEGGDHYLKMGVQPWSVIDSWPLEQQIGYHRGNALKYIMRLGHKDTAEQDARKAIHYMEQLVSVLEEAI